MGSVRYIKQRGRKKRTLPGEDHYSALVFYSSVLPAGFAADDRIKEISDEAAAITLGITPDHADTIVKVMYYHIAEAFRINPDIVLWVGIFAEPVGAHTFAELDQVRTFAKGKVRQAGVWTKKDFATGDMALLQGKYTDAFNVFTPFEIFYSANFHGEATADLPSLAAMTAENVHLLIAQDGAATGAALYGAAAYSIGTVGAAIGAVSLARVHENIGWVDRFNMAQTGGELDVPALCNGELVSSLSSNITKDEGTLDVKRLIFLKNYPNITGTYFNDSHGACPADSDYAYAEDNRTIDKAIRGTYARLARSINGPALVNSTTGRLAAQYVEFLQLEAGKALEEMRNAGELSGYTVEIDPDQDVISTSQIEISINNTNVGVSRRFVVKIA